VCSTLDLALSCDSIVFPRRSERKLPNLPVIASRVVRRDLIRTSRDRKLISRGVLVVANHQGTMLATVTAALVSTCIALIGALQSGPYGIAALTVIGALIWFPATQCSAVYGVSVGHRLSMVAMAGTLMVGCSVPRFSIGFFATASAILHGMIPFLYTCWVLVTTNAKTLVPPNKLRSRLQRVLVAIISAPFFASLTTPLLYMLRHPPERAAATSSLTAHAPWLVACTGTTVSYVGVLVKPMVDTYMYVVNAHQAPSRVGIIAGAAGEVLFWSGLWLAGLPSYGPSIVAWVVSTAGLCGIVSILYDATKRRIETSCLRKIDPTAA
jgi:hypothetical protein